MCGILGVLGGAAAADLLSQLARLRHRGPDGSGVCETAAGALGHTRLAIVDVEHGGQPQAYERLHISYNGEIYNHHALRREYLAQEVLATHSDTEVVLRLYARLGPSSVELLDGMFAIAILDDETLFLARDPIGIKPLYLGFAGSALYFASELKALPAEVERVEVFPPGHWYHSQMGLHRFYHVGQARGLLPVARDEVAAQGQVSGILREAVVKRLMADVPVGVSLSGGLDSSIVTLLAKEGLIDKGQDVLHSFGVGVAGSEDLAAAREVAAFLGTRHHERVYDTQEMLDILPEVLYSLESCDPALVRSAIPNYFLAELAAEEVKVMLTGEGADELYAGYDYLRDFAQAEQLQQEMEYIVGALHNTNLQRADRMSMRFGLGGAGAVSGCQLDRLCPGAAGGVEDDQDRRPWRAGREDAVAQRLCRAAAGCHRAAAQAKVLGWCGFVAAAGAPRRGGRERPRFCGRERPAVRRVGLHAAQQGGVVLLPHPGRGISGRVDLCHHGGKPELVASSIVAHRFGPRFDNSGPNR